MYVQCGFVCALWFGAALNVLLNVYHDKKKSESHYPSGTYPSCLYPADITWGQLTCVLVILLDFLLF